MKENSLFYKVVITIVLVVSLFMTYDYYKRMHPYHPSCDDSPAYVAATIEEWLKERVDKSEWLKKYDIEVSSVIGFNELNSIPSVMDRQLYDDIKGSAVCKATAVVDIATKDNSKKITEEIHIRFQLTKNGMSMSGFDVDNMMEQLGKAVKDQSR